MDEYFVVIVVTFVGFVALAAVLLVPVYLFLKREERASQSWTREELARRYREQPPPANGATEDTDSIDG